MRKMRRGARRRRLGIHLFVRVHLLREMHNGDELCLSELRRRAGAKAAKEVDRFVQRLGENHRGTQESLSIFALSTFLSPSYSLAQS
jgi:hypothetical protein